MTTVQITIDDKSLTVPEGLPVRKAALKNGIYIPGICGHPDLPHAREVALSEQVYRDHDRIVGEYSRERAGDDGNCNLCLVAVEGESDLVRACEIKSSDGLRVHTSGENITKARHEALSRILAHHPHACLTCAQKEGCSLTQCSTNVPEDERCCILLNRCELGKVVDFIGLPESTPKYVNAGFPKIVSEPLFERDYNLCIGCSRCVRICRNVRGVDVLATTLKDERIWIGTHRAGELPESYCRFCGACVEVCPTGALMDKPDLKPVRSGDLAPCREACPAGIDIPAYVRHIAVGDYAGALKVIYDRVPFPGILGYVCFHPCEDVCKRTELGESIAICALKRFVYENAPAEQIRKLEKPDSTGKKVAIVGSGPAGMTAAYYLARAGHQIVVFEEQSRPGGMLRNAIPEYRLPESVLDDELIVLHDLGVDIRLESKLGRDFQLADLTDSNDAVLLAIGASDSRNIGIPGENLTGIVPVLDFLHGIRSEDPLQLSGKVIIIGGGNVAVDAAMSVRRLGVDDVTMVCLEGRDEMPAHSWELDQAMAEGIKIEPGWGPAEFLESHGKLEKIRFKRCTVVFDEKGNFAPRYDESDTVELDADYAILAIGQQVDRDGLEMNLAEGPAGTIKVDSENMLTSIPKVFAAGDDVAGPASVVEAIASGRKAANSIDRALGGPGIETEATWDEVGNDPYLGRDEEFHQRESIRPHQTDPMQRVTNFDVIECSLSESDAQAVALQCLRCNLRATITPVVLPPDKWQPLTDDSIANIPATEGVYQLAGADKKVTKIVGTVNLYLALQEEIGSQSDDILFCWEEDRMYSKRESELIQQHLQQYGEMPGGGADDLDDLF